MSTTTTPPVGSTADMLARLKSVLPLRWFPDETPILDGLLTGLASVGATLYAMLAYVGLQTRVATITDSFIDLAASDYCGPRLVRRAGETDAFFRIRLQRELLRTRGTRGAAQSALQDLTGRVPSIVEPARPADTGGYGVACGYSTAGAWGSAVVPFQCFIVAYRPFAPGAAPWLGGPGPGAPMPAADIDVQGTVADAEIYAAVANVMPCAAIGWTALQN